MTRDPIEIGFFLDSYTFREGEDGIVSYGILSSMPNVGNDFVPYEIHVFAVTAQGELVLFIYQLAAETYGSTVFRNQIALSCRLLLPVALRDSKGGRSHCLIVAMATYCSYGSYVKC